MGSIHQPKKDSKQLNIFISLQFPVNHCLFCTMSIVEDLLIYMDRNGTCKGKGH